MDNALVQEFKIALEKERDAVVAELRSIATPDPALKGNWDTIFPEFDTGGPASHSAEDEHADEVEEYEMRLGAEASLESRLLAITHALERIADKTYGVCKKCNKELPIERLRANAAADTHTEHSEN